jgi:hypothetical protein
LLISLLITFVVRGALNFAIEKIAYSPKRFLKLAPGDHCTISMSASFRRWRSQEANYKALHGAFVRHWIRWCGGDPTSKPGHP